MILQLPRVFSDSTELKAAFLPQSKAILEKEQKPQTLTYMSYNEKNAIITIMSVAAFDAHSSVLRSTALIRVARSSLRFTSAAKRVY